MDLSSLRAVFVDIDAGASTEERSDSVGWASASLLETTQHVVLVSAAGWQVVMALATVSSLGFGAWPLAAAFLCLGALTFVTKKHSVALRLIPLGMGALGLAGYLASGDMSSTLVFAACWQIDISSGLIALSILHRYSTAVVFVQAAIISGTLLIAIPSWGVQLPLAIVATQVAIVVGMRMGLRTLFQVTKQTDASAAIAARVTRSAWLTKRLSSQIAEEARVLHDTAINTLGAIANGGAGTRDRRVVAAQCERDVTLLRELRLEQRKLDVTDLRDIFSLPGLPIVRTGLDDDAITQAALLFPSRTIDGLVRATREAVTNATKHSRAHQIEIDVASNADALSITVSDKGVGFDQEAPIGRGIDNSIHSRALDYGFTAQVLSVVGAGTTVTFDVRAGDATPALDVDELATNTAEVTTALLRKAGSLWGLGVAVVSVVLTAIGGTNHYLALFPMIGLMLAAWLATRNAGSRLVRTLPVLLTAVTCVVFFLSAAATSFGSVGAVHWQALAPTGAFVMMLTSGPSARTVRLAYAAWVATVATIAGIALLESPTAAQIVVIAGCVGWGFASIWRTFQKTVERVSADLAQSQREAFTARVGSEADAAAQRSYLRWVDAGLDSAAELLQSIADGSRDPRDEDARRESSAEERYLRQLVQVSPQLVNLGQELLPTLLQARKKGVDFVLRLGEQDASDHEVAREIAGVVETSLEATPTSGSLRVSLYPVQEGLQLTLIGPAVASLPLAGTRARTGHLGDIGLLELTYSTPSTETRLGESNS